jgi:putative tryptophan/tyrosine transport system substrate-binding protein
MQGGNNMPARPFTNWLVAVFLLLLTTTATTATTAGAAERALVLYLTPDEPFFRKGKAEFAARLDATSPNRFNVELVPAIRWTHLAKPSDLVNELASLASRKPLAVITTSLDTARAAASANLPFAVVARGLADPVGMGAVPSLTNGKVDVTGYSYFLPAVEEKRLELLRRAVPHVKKIGVLIDPYLRDFRAAAHAGLLEYRVQGAVAVPVVMTNAEEGVRAIRSSRSRGIDAWSVRRLLPIYSEQDAKKVIAALDAEKLPAIYDQNWFVAQGGLISYQAVFPDPDETWIRMIMLLANGVPARDIPFERPRHFSLAYNTETAARLGLSPSPDFLRMVDVSFPCNELRAASCVKPAPLRY